MTKHTQHFRCDGCSTEFTPRPTTRGTRPRWCPACRANPKRHTITCETCGTTHRAAKADARYCSLSCASEPRKGRQSRPKPSPKPLADMRSPLRRAVEEQDWETVGTLLAQKVDKRDGHWHWTGRIRAGYGEVRVGPRYYATHRLMLAAKIGADLGVLRAHHICAVRDCINPAHLQAVTDRENTAEMLARNSYIERILELEAALRSLDHAHPLLAFARVA